MRGIGDGRHYDDFPVYGRPFFIFSFSRFCLSTRKAAAAAHEPSQKRIKAKTWSPVPGQRLFTRGHKRIKTTTKSGTRRRRENVATSMEARNGWVTPLYTFNAQIGFR
jgi:hypothetical protein